MTNERFCAAPECTEPAKRGGYCWTHYRWSREGAPMSAPKDKRKAGMSPLDRLLEAALTYANFEDDLESDSDFERKAVDNLCAAAERYTTKLWAERARAAALKAKRSRTRRGPGRPVGTFRGESRWSKWRRAKFAEVLERALKPQVAK